MKTQSNALLVKKLYKQITDTQLELTTKQELYAAALKADEPFEKIKELYTEIKSLRKQLKQSEAQVTISNYLAAYSN